MSKEEVFYSVDELVARPATTKQLSFAEQHHEELVQRRHDWLVQDNKYTLEQENRATFDGMPQAKIVR